MTLAIVVLAAAFQAQAGPQPEVISLDLGKLPSGPVQSYSIEADRPFRIRVEGYARGARYQVRQAFSEGGATGTFIEVDTDRLLPTETPGCARLVARLRAFYAATDEAAAAETRAGRDEALLSDDCEEVRRFRRYRDEERKQVTSLDGLKKDTSMTLFLDRLEPGPRTLEAKPVVRRWTIRVVASKPALPTTAAADSAWRYPNEVAWLTAEVAGTIARLAASLGGQPSPAGVEARPTGKPNNPVLVTFREQGSAPASSMEIDVRSFLFGPKAYRELARARLGKARLSRAARPDEGFIERLTEPTTRVLAQEDRRLSREIARTPLSAELHEQAALLQSALALRDHAGRYSDLRLSLCRITARLAIVQALRNGKPMSESGRLAEIALLALTERQTDVLTRLGQWPSPTPSVAAWHRALRLKATEDWRALTQPARATLLERIFYFRAVARRVGIGRAIDFLAHHFEPAPDWQRVALGFDSVQAGNVFGDDALAMELADLAESRRILDGATPPAQRPFIAPADGDGESVIGRSLWVDYHRRHAAWVADRVTRYLESLGADGAAKKAHRDAANKALDGTAQLALVWLRTATTQVASTEGRSICADLLAATNAAPESLSAGDWLTARYYCELKLLRVNAWFGEELLPGTAFDANYRWDLGGIGLAKAYAIAPYDPTVVAAELAVTFRGEGRVGKRELDLASFDKFYEAVLGYDVRVMYARGKLLEDRPDEYAKQYETIAEFDPNAWRPLGLYLVRQDRPDQAAAAFERALDDADNWVSLSHDLDWLTNYYEDRGHPADALRVAKAAADVYSFVGLGTMARLMERRKLWAEAKRIYDQQVERYQNRTDLAGFLWRYERKVGDGRFDSKEGRGPLPPEKGAAPPEPVALKDFRTEPKEGLTVTRLSAVFSKRGLEDDDVIVAVSGYRVRSTGELRYVQGLADTEDTPVILWSNARRQFVETSLPLSRGQQGLVLSPKIRLP